MMQVHSPGPNPMFTRPSDPPAPFPWIAVIAVGLAGVALGTAIGYQLGRNVSPAPSVVASSTQPVRPAPNVNQTPTPTPLPAGVSTDTDVAVKPPVPSPSATASPAIGQPALSEPSGSPAAGAPIGRILVRSVPTGAVVMVDGRRIGTAPQSVRELAIGPHTVQVTRPGYLAFSERVTLTAKAPSHEVNARLERPLAGQTPASRGAQTGSLTVDSRPRGAKITLDGHPVGETPLKMASLSAGTHSVRADLTGYKTVLHSVTIKPGVVTPLSFSMERTAILPIDRR